MFANYPPAPRAWLGLLCLLGAVLSLPGCGPDGPKRLPVEGKVLLDGKPFAMSSHTQGTITLHPNAAKGNQSLDLPLGTIDSEGFYKIDTGAKSGAAPGWYKVTVNAAKVIDPKNPYHSASDFLVPERYRNKETTPLVIEVVESPAAGAYDLKVDSR